MSAEQTLLLCDESGLVTGYAGRAACHVGEGKLHRAIHVVLLDMEGRVLLQRRRSALWDGVLDATCATHPLHTEDGDESDLAAALRCVQVECGVEASLQERFAFVYDAKDGAFSEREYCTLFTGVLRDVPVLQPEFAYELLWADAGVLAMRMQAQPELHTPWSRIAIERLFPRPVDD